MAVDLRRRHFGGRVRPSLEEVIRPRTGVVEPAIRVPITDLDPSDLNPRARVEVEELAASIETYGLLQPIVVRKQGVRYQLIAGHRRYAAVRLLGERHPDDTRWHQIEAVLREADDDRAYLMTLVENLQREDLTAKEEAAALEVLVRQEGWSVRRVAEVLHRAPIHVSRRLRVFEDPALAPHVFANRVTVSTAEELLRAEPEARTELVEQAVAESWAPATARQRVRARRNDSLHADRWAALAQRLRAAREGLQECGNDDLPAIVRLEASLLMEWLSALV